MESLARLFIIIGVVFFVLAGVVYLLGRSGMVLGRLPGDFRWQSGPMTCVVALGTSLLLSVVLTIVLNIVIRLLNR
jgi:hypothetical protein